MKNPFKRSKGDDAKREEPKKDEKRKPVYIPGQTLRPMKNDEGERRYREMQERSRSEEARQRREREDRDRRHGKNR